MARFNGGGVVTIIPGGTTSRSVEIGATLCSPFRARNSKKPRRARSQQTDTVLSRLAGTRLPDEPVFVQSIELFFPKIHPFAFADLSHLPYSYEDHYFLF